MSEKPTSEEIEVRCPQCGELVRLSEKEADQTYSARCSKGHEIPLAKAI